MSGSGQQPPSSAGPRSASTGPQSSSIPPPQAGAAPPPPSNATSSQANLNQIVIEYLIKKGYNKTEAALRQESQNVDANGIVIKKRAEDSGGGKWAMGYSVFEQWIEDNLEIYKVLKNCAFDHNDDVRLHLQAEFKRLHWPIFVYCFLGLIDGYFDKLAERFFEEHKAQFATEHEQDLRALESVRNKEHVSENATARAYSNNRYRLTLTTAAYFNLVGSMEEKDAEGGSVILRILSNKMRINTIERAAGGSERLFASLLAKVGDDDIPDEDEGIPGHNPGSANTDPNAPPVLTRLNLGPLPMDSDMLDDLREEVEEEDIKNPPAAGQLSLVEELEQQIKREPSEDAPNRETVPLPKPLARDVEMEVRKLKEHRERMRIPSKTTGVGAGVSVAMFTFHNTFDSINCLDFSGDCTMVAAGTSDSYIRVWSLEGQNLKSMVQTPEHQKPTASRRLIGHSGPVYAVSFSPSVANNDRNEISTSSRYLLSSSADKTVRMWSLDVWSCLVVYKGHDAPVWDVTWGPYGHYFLTGSHDHTARLWSTDTIAPLRIFAGHDQDVDCVTFHPNNSYAFTGSSDKTVRMWDVSRGSAVRLFTGHTANITCLSCAPSGKTLASADDSGAIILWDLASGRRVKRMRGHGKGGVWSMSWSVEGSLLVSSGADCTVRIWDVFMQTDGTTTKTAGDAGAKADGATAAAAGVQSMMGKKAKAKDATVTPDQISALHAVSGTGSSWKLGSRHVRQPGRAHPSTQSNNLVHNAHIQRLLRAHEVIPLHQPLDILHAVRLGQMPHVNPIQLLAHTQNLLGVDRNITRLPEVPAARLVDHDAAMRQGEALARGAAGQQQRAHGRSLADADGADGGGDVGHGVVDGEAGGDAAAGRVDVQRDGLVGGVGLEEEQLGDDAGGEAVVDGAGEGDDAFFEEARVDVVCGGWWVSGFCGLGWVGGGGWVWVSSYGVDVIEVVVSHCCLREKSYSPLFCGEKWWKDAGELDLGGVLAMGSTPHVAVTLFLTARGSHHFDIRKPRGTCCNFSSQVLFSIYNGDSYNVPPCIAAAQVVAVSSHGRNIARNGWIGASSAHQRRVIVPVTSAMGSENTPSHFRQTVTSLRDEYMERRLNHDLYRDGRMQDCVEEQVKRYTVWLENGGSEWQCVRLYDIPGTLSGEILRLRRGLPNVRGHFEVEGDIIRHLDQPPKPPVSDEDDSEDVSFELEKLPLIEVDADLHFQKKPKYKSEILNLLACQGGTCPGTPLSAHITPLLGRSKDGALILPKYTRHPLPLHQLHTLASIKQWLLDLINGLQCLHSLDIVHRDLRIANVVFSNDHKNMLICDLEGRWGNRNAPEVLHNQSTDCGWSEKSDIYDIGPLIKGMYYANAPINSFVEWPVPSPLDRIVNACMHPAPDDRPSLEELALLVVSMGIDDDIR
ncbi:hypothetical protein FH972_025528 [Carpinus fangiana]|uniref:TFIID subunit TAF5 NTD2 domain-containing protein n=1 Tax=Carpinus fangiana TaxID=176857 RepID=A0A5N6L1J6_9ROSI|nr:hypothetical protein FH972_025528 [Carpinus fangiana]